MNLPLLIGMLTALANPSAGPGGMPALSPDLEGVSAIACVKIGESGAIKDAFLISSTGDMIKDRELLDWIQMLSWPSAAPDEAGGDMWFPMPLAIGEGLKAPEAPKSCAPSGVR